MANLNSLKIKKTNKMKKTILVAGGTGDLGKRIIAALLKRNANVIAIVRYISDNAKVAELEAIGAKVIRVNMDNVTELTNALKGVSCVVSALAGLKETIVDAQSLLLDAAVAAGVPRFIPSDYSSDFTQIADGENRNFDLRKAFHKKLDAAPIKSTAIMNGAFADILFYNTPFYNLKDNSIAYWGSDADFKVDFTTKDDTAAYTSAVALDDAAPAILRIASFQVSANELAAMATAHKKTEFKIIPMGSLEALSAHNKKERAAKPEGENELYPSWQGSQYMHSMFSAQNIPLDNGRYNDIAWTGIENVLFNN
jgi:NAD(P)-dependent dehydrogenase (short-subunit alcohol dehydrogenase family)